MSFFQELKRWSVFRVGSHSNRYTVDRSPYKQDKLLPGTHIPELRVLE
jgi:hypothetical protein